MLKAFSHTPRMFLRSVGFLQEMWQAPAPKSDTVQEEQGFPVCPGQARKRVVTVGRPSLSSEKKVKVPRLG